MFGGRVVVHNQEGGVVRSVEIPSRVPLKLPVVVGLEPVDGGMEIVLAGKTLGALDPHVSERAAANLVRGVEYRALASLDDDGVVRVKLQLVRGKV